MIGYWLYKILFHLLHPIEPKAEPLPHQGPHYEAALYIALSLLGVMFLYHPGIAIRLPMP